MNKHVNRKYTTVEVSEIIEKVENANKILNENTKEFLSELEKIKGGVNICLKYNYYPIFII